MWIVRLALRNPYSVAVLALVILIAGILSIQSMLVDVFPVVDLPVVGEVWAFPGLSPEDVERRIITINERALSTTTSGISRIESQALPGIGNIRIYFESGIPIGAAVAQVSATAETVLRVMPPGITPPTILPFNASNVPIAQMTLTSDTLPEDKIFDYALNFIRVQLFTIPGLSVPAPYGGKTRQVSVDVDPVLATSKGISPQDVSNAIANSNLILPAGEARMGALDYDVLLNSSPLKVEDFNQIPILVVDGRPVLLGEVARAYDGYADQTNLVRINGRRAVFLNLLKKSDASTLTVIEAAKRKIPEILETAPKGLNVRVDFDQSLFVRATVNGLLREALIASALVSFMILFFLGNWRGVVIVCTSIPLSILVSVFGLKLTGDTLNIMTLGGLSLAIGMLVDDATVEIENIHRNQEHAPSLTIAILRGASQIALPAIVSTLAICIVFFPIVLLTGPAKFLFTPMSEAVVLAMLASYVLSRTLVPVLAKLLLADHREELKKGLAYRFNTWRDHHFDRLKQAYGRTIEILLLHRAWTLIGFFGAFLISLALPVFVLGTDFFPATDAGIMKFHLRGPSGLRIENTEILVTQIEQRLRSLIPADELQTINVNVGVPTSYNMAFVPTDNVGPMDAEVLIALQPKHHPTAEYVRKIRADMEKNFPSSVIYFQSADIVSQVLNFGLSSPIDIQLTSRDSSQAYELAKKLRDAVRKVPGTADVAIRQTFDYPTIHLDVDRERAAETGLTQKDVASSMLTALSSSSLVQPSFYVNPGNGVNYTVVVKEPLSKVESVADLLNTPVTSSGQNPLVQPGTDPLQNQAPSPPAQTLGNLARLSTSTSLSQVNHYNVQRVIDVIATPDGRDLGGVVSDIQAQVDKLGKLPPGMRISVRGQNEVMHESFTKLGVGMFLAVALVYMLMVTLFQSWLDPFIIMIAVPGALIGILWMLAITGTSINVVSLMGSIMAIGIAVSNSNLLVNFANEIRVESGISANEAAIQAGVVRLRPVLMTALAMILGMVPMALSFGEGGEQNAPLGRAVIGGLLVATVTTLLLVPVVYSLLRQGLPSKFVIQEHYKQEERKFDLEEQKAKKSPSEEPPREPSPPIKRHWGFLIGGVAAVSALLVAVLILSLARSGALRRDAKSRADKAAQGQGIEVAEAQQSPASREIELIGEARAYLTDNVYARVSGYVREVRFDKGDRVKKGQVLAVIESPETDRAYLAALADDQNKQRIAHRMKLLLKRKLIAPQDAEVSTAAADIARATLETQAVLKSYKEVLAPFDGIVTSRTVDPGNLLQSATNSQSAQQLLATISQTDTLRIYAFVDQKDAAFVKIGDSATISLQERPELKIDSQITRIAGELDLKTRKMLTEVDVPNLENPIVPGSFVRVRIRLQAPSYSELPVKALVMRDNKPYVPLLSMDNTVHFQPIEIADNDGQRLRIAQGIHAGQRVAIDLGSTVAEGAKVRPQPMAGEMHQPPPYPGAEAAPAAKPTEHAP